MARRPVFIPLVSGEAHVKAAMVEFEWHPGLAVSQKQKSIRALHESARNTLGLNRILEISSRSEMPEGVALSAFNLQVRGPEGQKMPLECAFQGSKVFRDGGPFTDLYRAHPRDAKRDARLKTHGEVTGFRWQGYDWPTEPRSAFYEWLYLNALHANSELARVVLEQDAFTDIEFNPEKSFSCQARAAALYKSLWLRGTLEAALTRPEDFLATLATPENLPLQPSLF